MLDDGRLNYFVLGDQYGICDAFGESFPEREMIKVIDDGLVYFFCDKVCLFVYCSKDVKKVVFNGST